jgi:hypothetical protein
MISGNVPNFQSDKTGVSVGRTLTIFELGGYSVPWK